MLKVKVCISTWFVNFYVGFFEKNILYFWLSCCSVGVFSSWGCLHIC